MLAKFMVVSLSEQLTAVMVTGLFYEELIAFSRRNTTSLFFTTTPTVNWSDGRHCGSSPVFPGAERGCVEFNSLPKHNGLPERESVSAWVIREVVKHLKLLKSNMDYGMFLPLQKSSHCSHHRGPVLCGDHPRGYERSAVMCSVTAYVPLMEVPKPEATMFVWALVPESFTSSEVFAVELVKRSGVLVHRQRLVRPERAMRMALVQDERN